jgi:hypothetical protein
LCRLDCGGAARCRDGGGAEVCCAEGEVCASGSCFAPITSCTDFIDCAPDEYCETEIGFCLPQPGGESCVSEPSGGDVAPTLLWRWDGTGAARPDSNQVMMAPMVASLNDDDGDGDADQDDVPDVVFHTYSGQNYRSAGILRAVSGADGSRLFDVLDHPTKPGSQVAIGDVDLDGWNDFVTCRSDGLGILVFDHDGILRWPATGSGIACNGAAPSLANLDDDPQPEIIVRYTVLDAVRREVQWHHDCVGEGGYASTGHSPCDFTTAADLDGDGLLEVVGGNVAYNGDGTLHYDRTADYRDGYPAIGDLDLDGTPEVVVVHSSYDPWPYAGDHWLHALDSDGSDFWPARVDINAGMAPAADLTANTVGGGGPPTIANLDDDPEPEIAVAGAYAYAVFEADSALKWVSRTDDRSSRTTGSSVFDFDGDGVDEVVYNDQQWLRVYDGPSGTVRFCLCNTSATLFEYPVIADVDADGHAEIVVASNDSFESVSSCTPSPSLGSCEMGRIEAGETVGSHGIRVFGSPTRDWVSTRRIWNQHTYHVTNVNERGEVPVSERANWTIGGLNNFRLNVQRGARNLPDPVPIDLAVDVTGCPDAMEVHFRIENRGWAAMPRGVEAVVFLEDVECGRSTTSGRIWPGESEALSVTCPLAPGDDERDLVVRVVVDDGVSVAECRAENNIVETIASCLLLI